MGRRFLLILVAVVALVASWSLFFVLWPLTVLFSLGAAIFFGLRGRRPGAALVLLASPLCILPAVSLIGGTFSYFHGGARLMTYGMPRESGLLIDPATGLPWTSSGCVVNGSEPFYQWPNNFAIRALTRLLGPGRGAFRGAVPLEADTVRRLQQAGEELAPGQLNGMRLTWAGGSIDLDPFVAAELSRLPAPVRLAQEGEHLVHLRGGRIIVSLDRATGHVIARYFEPSSAAGERVPRGSAGPEEPPAAPASP